MTCGLGAIVKMHLDDVYSGLRRRHRLRRISGGKL
jgi:hypothetical protein